MDWIGYVHLTLVPLVSLKRKPKCARLKGRLPCRISTKVQVESFAAEGRVRMARLQKAFSVARP